MNRPDKGLYDIIIYVWAEAGSIGTDASRGTETASDKSEKRF